MPGHAIFWESKTDLGQEPDRLRTLEGKEYLEGVGAVWSKEGLLALTEDVCIVEMMRHLLDYVRKENCGKCTPCRDGSKEIYNILGRIVSGKAKVQDLVHLGDLSRLAVQGSDCSLGEIMGNMLLDSFSIAHPRYRQEQEEIVRTPLLGEWLNNGEYLAHIKGTATCPTFRYSCLHFTPCQLRCPLGTDIAYFLAAIAMNKTTEAKSHVFEVNYIPKVLGRVCGLCKSACTLRDEPSGAIDINSLKEFVCCHTRSFEEFKNVHLDRASHALAYPISQLQNGSNSRKVAVLGGGPSGIVSAVMLSKLGYRVTLFEAGPKLGGLLRYGIPSWRLTDELLEEDLELLLADSDQVEVKLNTKVGKDVHFPNLLASYDAIVLAVGAYSPIKCGAKNEDHPKVLDFLRFMRDYNIGKGKRLGKRAAVIGAGNSAMDVAIAAVKLGYETTIYYRRTRDKMRADAHEIHLAEKTGANFEFEMVPLEVAAEGGEFQGVYFDHKGERVFRKADVLIPAIGQAANLSFMTAEVELKTDKWGTICVNPQTGATSHPKIFAAGDVFAGRTVANSLQEGVAAVLGVHCRLSESSEKEIFPDHIAFPAIRQIAAQLCGIEDPFNEKLRDRWHNSLKSFLRGTGRTSLTAAHKEAGACQRCRQIVLLSHLDGAPKKQ